MFFDEEMLLDLRLNIMDKYIDKFVITEATYTHSGNPKKLIFDINKFSKFKDKIIYIVVDKPPPDLFRIEEGDNDKQDIRGQKLILNGYKRDNYQRQMAQQALGNIEPDDWVIINDIDEIPNLKNINFNNINNQFIFFKQDIMYYKLNLKLENCTWIGTRACRMKNLESPQWLRNIKDRLYPWWRLDTLFSKNKYRNIKFIDNGGWHFSYLKTPEEIEKKLKSYLHHREYELNPIGVDKIKKLIEQKITVYNLKTDKRLNQFNSGNKLNKIDINILPKYILENKDKLKKWIES